MNINDATMNALIILAGLSANNVQTIMHCDNVTPCITESRHFMIW